MEPFVKWAGGKRQLLDKLWERTPNKYGTYFEPFLGGGAMLLNTKPKKAIVNDINEQLICVYKRLQEDPKKVISLIRSYDEGGCDKDKYLEMRAKYNKKITDNAFDFETAALFIWINKHCFNGLYRVNSKGLFNVPYNNKQTGKSMDEANFMNIGYFLQHNDIDIRCMDFEELCEECKAGDFIYFDSPYLPESETAYFTDYTKDGFMKEDHERLAKLYRLLDSKGCMVMLSNNNVPLVHELYKGFKIDEVDARRSINSDAKKRTGKEVIITNYEI